jgi:transcriptional regulator with XRE-family HTH domain
MNITPLTAKALNNVITANGWDQSELATRADLHGSAVSLHLSGKRPVRDDHLPAYCRAIGRTEQAMLVSAWLQDTLDESTVANVLDNSTNRLNEEARTWRPGLNDEQRQMLDWWAAKLAADDELDHIFRAITRKAGWTPPPPL